MSPMNSSHYVCTQKLEGYNCIACGYLTRLKVLYLKHEHNSNGFLRETLKSYNCQKCKNFHSNSVLTLMKHKRKKCKFVKPASKEEIIIWYHCEQCPYQSRHRSEAISHVKLLHFSGEICCMCQYCGHKTRTFPGMKKHIIGYHLTVPTMFECIPCNFRSTSEKKYKKHMEMHTRPTEWNCDKCDYGTSSKYNFSKHVKWNHLTPENIKWLKCDQCPFKTKWRNVLQRHVKLKRCQPEQSSSDNSWNKCESCESEPFAGENEWLQCDQCPFKVRCKHNLARHIMIRHSGPNLGKCLQCQFCDYKTDNALNLSKHRVSSHKEVLKEKKALSEKRFKCEQCSYRTTSNYSLREHLIALHTAPEDIQWFECEHCFFKAKLKSQLRRHVKWKHPTSGDVQWEKCEFCDYRVTTKTSLKKHVSMKHGGKN